MVYNSKELESTFIEIHRQNKKNVVVGCIYRHPGMSVESFNKDFLAPALNKLVTEQKPLVLLGDFNIDLLNPRGTAAIDDFLDIIGSFSLLPQILGVRWQISSNLIRQFQRGGYSGRLIRKVQLPLR